VLGASGIFVIFRGKSVDLVGVSASSKYARSAGLDIPGIDATTPYELNTLEIATN
jgi:hypothetical protein